MSINHHLGEPGIELPSPFFWGTETQPPGPRSTRHSWKMAPPMGPRFASCDKTCRSQGRAARAGCDRVRQKRETRMPHPLPFTELPDRTQGLMCLFIFWLRLSPSQEQLRVSHETQKLFLTKHSM